METILDITDKHDELDKEQTEYYTKMVKLKSEILDKIETFNNMCSRTGCYYNEITLKIKNRYNDKNTERLYLFFDTYNTADIILRANLFTCIEHENTGLCHYYREPEEIAYIRFNPFVQKYVIEISDQHIDPLA